MNGRNRDAKRFVSVLPTPQYEPGLYTHIFAAKMGWPIRKNNILVEGESDLNYFKLADEFYTRETSRTLIGSDLAIFPTGSGDAGGTYGLLDGFPQLRNHIRLDTASDDKELFRVVVLLDNDKAGRDAMRRLMAGDTELLENRDLFLLRRVLPRGTREYYQLTRHIEQENNAWKELDCEIEDLIHRTLIELFIEENHGCLHRTRPSVILENAHHYEFADAVKPNLFRFVRKHAEFDQLVSVIEVLKSLRFYLRLDPDGDQV